MIVATTGGKGGEGVGEGKLTAGSQTGGNADHVGFGDAHVVGPFGEVFEEILGTVGGHQVGFQHHDAIIGFGAFRKEGAINLAHFILVFYKGHVTFLLTF